MKHLPILAVTGLLGAVLITSCKKDIDTPPEHSLPVGSVITMTQLRALFTGSPVHFDSAMSVYAVVTADERNGNLYKEVYVQDDSAAINVRLLFSGGLYPGRPDPHLPAGLRTEQLQRHAPARFGGRGQQRGEAGDRRVRGTASRDGRRDHPRAAGYAGEARQRAVHRRRTGPCPMPMR
jgi:hypothetical protein